MIDRFITWLKAQVGSIYVWGAQGEVDFNEDWIRKMETSNENANRAIALFRKRKSKNKDPIAAYDCSGLIIKYMLDNKLIDGDTTAAGIRKLCATIPKAQLQAGDFVFRKNNIKIYHIGVYIGNDKVIHARGRDYGVVEETLTQNGKDYWNAFGRYEKLQKKQKEQEEYVNMELSILKNGSKGEQVKTLQKLLDWAEYPVGDVDGSFGAKTEKAVTAYQTDNKLIADGVVGAKTWSKMLKGE